MNKAYLFSFLLTPPLTILGACVWVCVSVCNVSVCVHAFVTICLFVSMSRCPVYLLVCGFLYECVCLCMCVCVFVCLCPCVFGLEAAGLWQQTWWPLHNASGRARGACSWQTRGGEGRGCEPTWEEGLDQSVAFSITWNPIHIGISSWVDQRGFKLLNNFRRICHPCSHTRTC